MYQDIFRSFHIDIRCISAELQIFQSKIIHWQDPPCVHEQWTTKTNTAQNQASFQSRSILNYYPPPVKYECRYTMLAFFFFFRLRVILGRKKKTELKARIMKGFKFRNLAGRRLKCCQSSSSKPGSLTSSQSNSWSLLSTSLKTSSLCLSCRVFLGDDEASICLLPQLSLSSIAIKESPGVSLCSAAKQKFIQFFL